MLGPSTGTEERTSSASPRFRARGINMFWGTRAGPGSKRKNTKNATPVDGRGVWGEGAVS